MRGTAESGPKRQGGAAHRCFWHLSLILLVLVLLLGGFSSWWGSPSVDASSSMRGHGYTGESMPDVTSSPSPSPGLTLGIHSSAPEICPNDATTCGASVGDSLVSLAANGSSVGVRAWPAVTVVFVIETAPYDGVYDPTAGDPGNDSCALVDPSTRTLCWESDGVPVFAARSGQIAGSIVVAHPGTKFTFGLVDYAAAYDRWDDSDGYEYHVDIGQPVPASEFGQAVNSTFVNGTLQGHTYLPGSGLSDNILESPSITALYGVLAGAGISWTNDTHHVIVWMGATVPRDPNYPENYCVSPSAHVPYNVTCTAATASKFMAPTCEPSYVYGTTGIVSPNCEGWVLSHNGLFGDSVADFSRTSPSCVDSLGGNCTIDSILLLNGLTEWTSGAWPNKYIENVSTRTDDANNIFRASCHIANATGGSWNGPIGENCSDGSYGQVWGVIGNAGFGTYNDPFINNTGILSAFASVGLGAPPETVIAFGSAKPMFTFATTGSIAIDPDFSPHAVCSTPTGPLASCPQAPTLVHVGSSTVLEWNWSSDPNLNTLYVGDSWAASLRVMATGPPVNTPVPIDSCTTVECIDYGSKEVGGFFTSANYFEPIVNVTQDASFPLALITVVGQPPNSGGTSPPSPPPSGGILPPVPAPSPVAPPVVQPAPVLLTVVAGGISVQAGVAGLLAAGFARVVIQPRAVSMKIGVKSGALTSKFDSKAQANSVKLGRFE